MAEVNKNFLDILEKFYENGIFKKVYSSERATVCNVFNQMYVAFSHDMMEHYDKDFPGFVMNSDGLKNIVSDDKFVLTYFQNIPRRKRKELLVVLDNQFLNNMIANKQEYQNLPPNPYIDLAYEQQLIASQSKKDELASMLDEHQVQSAIGSQQKGVPTQK